MSPKYQLPQEPLCGVCNRPTFGWDPTCDFCGNQYHRTCGTIQRVGKDLLPLCNTCTHSKEKSVDE